MDVSEFREFPLLGILRGVSHDSIDPLVETVVSAGLKFMEITMNTEGAPALIRHMAEAARGRLVIGAGTVLTPEDLHSALDAGATFIVMPVLIPEIVSRCRRSGVPLFPGAFTPQEIYNAWNAGATMVKVFPAGGPGPKYFKEIKGPFGNIDLLACGGVNRGTIGQYFSCGASAVAFGGSVFRREWLEQSDYESIGRCITDLIDSWRESSRVP